jgi:hypothetical protein
MGEFFDYPTITSMPLKNFQNCRLKTNAPAWLVFKH